MSEREPTRPAKSLLQGGPYTSAAATDIRERFRLMMEAQREKQHAPNVARLRKTK